MPAPRLAQISLAAVLSAPAISPAAGLLTSSWSSTPSGVSGYTQNDLEVFTSIDWLSTQLLVELSSGQFHYVTQGITPSLDPTLLVGAAANTSLTFPAAGDTSDPLNSQIPGLGALPNVGTGGVDGLGGSASAVIDQDTFDLTYFGPPTETDDVTAGTPLTLAQMTVSNGAYGTWAIRLRNSDPNDPQNQPAETLYANGFVFRGVFYDTQIPGDIDNDGDIDGVDVGALFSNFTGPEGVGKTLADGDMDADGDIDGVDLALIFGQFSGPLSPSPAPVPEPGSALLVLGASAMVLRRRAARR